MSTCMSLFMSEWVVNQIQTIRYLADDNNNNNNNLNKDYFSIRYVGFNVSLKQQNQQSKDKTMLKLIIIDSYNFYAINSFSKSSKLQQFASPYLLC